MRGDAPLSSTAKKVRLLKSYLQGRPVWCSWQVTRRCGSFCHFCEHRADGGDLEVGIEECQRIAARLGEKSSLIVSLTGGDPFLRSDLPELVSFVARRHFPVATTHGWLVTREKARAVWKAGLDGASVLLHDADPERHDVLAGMRGAHARALEALAALAEERVRGSQHVNVKARLSAGGAEAVEGLLNLAAQYGATVTVEPPFRPHDREALASRGRAIVKEEESPDSLRALRKPDGRVLEGRLSQRLLELKRGHANFRAGSFFLERIDEAMERGVAGCQAGRAFLNVDHRGRVSKCVEFQAHEDRVGNLAEETIDEVLPRLRRVHAQNQCRSCWYASRGEIEGLYTIRGLLGAFPMFVRT